MAAGLLRALNAAMAETTAPMRGAYMPSTLNMGSAGYRLPGLSTLNAVDGALTQHEWLKCFIETASVFSTFSRSYP